MERAEDGRNLKLSILNRFLAGDPRFYNRGYEVTMDFGLWTLDLGPHNLQPSYGLSIFSRSGLGGNPLSTAFL